MVKPEKRRWQDLSTKQRGALVVLGALELGLAAAAWTDLARREPAEVRGPRRAWAPVIAINIVGPLSYLHWGRRRPPSSD